MRVLSGIEPGQIVQGSREIERLGAIAAQPGQFRVERRALPAEAALLRHGRARTIDEDAAGEPGGEGEEVRAVLERQPAHAHQADEDLMDHHGGLQGRVRPLIAQAGFGDGVEPAVIQRGERPDCAGISALPARQKLGNVALPGIRHAPS